MSRRNTTARGADNRLPMAASRIVACVCVLLGTGVAHAGPRDFSLIGLGRPQSDELTDPAVARYRALATELGFVVGPRLLAGADSLGSAGFELAFALSYTGISAGSDYWQGTPEAPVFESAVTGGTTPSGFWAPTLQVRKGLPFSSDLGLSMAYLGGSSMLALGLDLKVGLFESYLPRYVPDVALRAAVGHLVGAPELTQTTLEFDLLASYTFVVKGAFRVTPSLGLGRMMIRTSSGVLDETPAEVVDPADQTQGPGGSLYRFPVLRFGDHHITRLFLGAHAVYGFGFVGYFLDVGFIPSSIGADNTHVSHTLKIGLRI